MTPYRAPIDLFLKDDCRALWLASLIVAAGLGMWARLAGLGASSLAVDEYYLLTSSQNILRHGGLPAFDCAGYYVRGLLHQYVSAGLLLLGLVPEIAIRLPSAIADIVSVIGAFLLAKHVGGRRVAAFVAVLLCLSLWQVEFARFGRMYALFQACTVFYAFAAVKYLEFAEPRHFLWMIAISLIATLGHEGGALLAAFTVVALTLAPNRPSLLQIVVAVAVAGAAVMLLAVDLRYLDTTDAYSPELLSFNAGQVESYLKIDLPRIQSIAVPGRIGLLVMSAGLSAWLCTTYLRDRELRGSIHVVLVVFVWISIIAALSMQLYLLAAVLLLVAALFAIVQPRALIEGRVRVALSVSVGLLVVAGLAHAHFAGEGVLAVIKGGLRYPDLYLEVFLPWVRVLPGMGVAISTVAGAAGCVVLYARHPSAEYRRYQLLLGVTFTLLVAAVLSKQPYYSTRYTYFLYPLFLVLLVQGAIILRRCFLPARKLAVLPLLLIGVIFVASNDFDLRHLLRIAHPEYLYRTSYPPALANHFYDRWDYRSVAARLDDNATLGDLVITTAYPVMPFYSTLVDVVYLDQTDSRIWIVSCREGRKDLWSNLPLLYDPDKLRSTIESATGTVWLVVPTERRKFRRPIEVELLARYRENEVYRSIDGHLALLRIP